MSRTACRICLKTLYRSKASGPGRPPDAHERCREVVRVHIWEVSHKPGPSKRAKTRPPESSQIAGNGPSCDFCGWVHGEVAEAVQCRARFERANRDLADLRKRRVQ